jgi:hypothetical protein
MPAVSDIQAQPFEEIEDERTEDREPESAPIRYGISSYGADFDVEGLVRRLQKEDIYVPSFQRQFVWDTRQASRFVESLLRNLPVPGIFLSNEADTDKLLVVDGQQRLMTLRHFYEGTWPGQAAVFALKGVGEPYEERTHNTLDDEDRRLLDNSIIHATVFKQDSPSSDDSSIYQVFERVNSGGRQLTAQEIRTAVHHGSPLRELLDTLNRDPNWRRIYGAPDLRLRDQELILRFLALMEWREEYKRPMVAFLNKFMRTFLAVPDETAQKFGRALTETVAVALNALGRGAFRPGRSLNAAVFDSVVVATARRLRRGPIENLDHYLQAYESLIGDPEYMDACARGTASEERVARRIEKATTAFDTV